MSATKPQTVCRLCSKIGKGYRSLFSDTNKIADKISKCLPILVNQNDELPSHICPLCLRSLNISYKLLIQAIKVDSQLRQRLLDTQMELKEQRARENVARSPQSMDAANLGICGICEIRFDDAGAFDSHMEMFHQSKWVCNLCQSDFPTSEELLQHKHKTHYDIDNIEKPQESECVDSGTIDIKEERISDSEHSDSEYTGDTNIPKRASKRQGSAKGVSGKTEKSTKTRTQQEPPGTESPTIPITETQKELTITDIDTDDYRNELRKKARQAAKARRQKIKDEYPDQHEVYLKEERERYIRRKSSGKIKSTSGLNKKERKQHQKVRTHTPRSELRKRATEAARAKRQKIKNEDPERHQLYLQEERERYLRRKAMGKVKITDESRRREKRLRREEQTECQMEPRIVVMIQDSGLQLKEEENSDS